MTCHRKSGQKFSSTSCDIPGAVVYSDAGLMRLGSMTIHEKDKVVIFPGASVVNLGDGTFGMVHLNDENLWI
jgi:hypothetical protein